MKLLKTLVLGIALLATVVALTPTADARPLTPRERNTVIGASIGAPIGAVTGWAICGPHCGWAGLGIGAVSGSVIGYILPPYDLANPLEPVAAAVVAPFVALAAIGEPAAPVPKRKKRKKTQ